VALSFVALTGCSNKGIEYDDAPQSPEDRRRYSKDIGSILGDKKAEITLYNFGNKQEDSSSEKPKVKGKGVNYKAIWQASLKTLSGFPLVSADFAGGVIITDWKTESKTTARQKLVVYVNTQKDDSSKNISDDDVKVMHYRQLLVNNQCVDQPANQESKQGSSGSIASEIKNKIKARAREIAAL